MTKRLLKLAEQEIAQHTREMQILAAAGASNKALAVYLRAIQRLRRHIAKQTNRQE